MRILHFKNRNKRHSVRITALMGAAEFRQLMGYIENLCLFATKTITEPSSFIKTGARHNCAKYLLFPVRLRRQFKIDDFDFSNLTCGTVEYMDKAYVIYQLPRCQGADSRDRKDEG